MRRWVAPAVVAALLAGFIGWRISESENGDVMPSNSPSTSTLASAAAPGRTQFVRPERAAPLCKHVEYQGRLEPLTSPNRRLLLNSFQLYPQVSEPTQRCSTTRTAARFQGA
jgi:hypothetical protein